MKKRSTLNPEGFQKNKGIKKILKEGKKTGNKTLKNAKKLGF